MEFYYDLFENLAANSNLCVNLSYYTNTNLILNKKKVTVKYGVYKWLYILSDNGINFRKMTLLELRDLLYEMLMCDFEYYSNGNGITTSTSNKIKIKALIKLIEKNMAGGNVTNDQSVLVNYSDLLKEHDELKAKYKKLCDVFESLKDT